MFIKQLIKETQLVFGDIFYTAQKKFEFSLILDVCAVSIEAQDLIF